ncbi:hypothetical protein H2198_009645 [Neophaeococcomyces mojaviensis]|uniref:Uncharacterized protein n=1 Tax=Neophaeococcomyces mojaviensis TaxID=3383035 RepID=A0ACC2ZTZ8_9EURO|nr:hypothetical protein H2198_009645 [Knufia sp. JES_112]
MFISPNIENSMRRRLRNQKFLEGQEEDGTEDGTWWRDFNAKLADRKKAQSFLNDDETNTNREHFAVTGGDYIIAEVW